MRPQCKAAVERAIGRELNQAESARIDELISKHMHQLARRDPDAWRQLSEAQRMEQAADGAVSELLAEAALKKFRLQRQIETHDAINRQTANWEGGRLDGLKRLIAAITDGKGSFRSVETLERAIRADALRQLSDVFEALDPRLFGFLENKEGVTTFTRAVFGERQGIDPTVVKAAEAWLKTAEDMRQQFNNAGGKVGKLESWSLPQHHAQLKVAKAGVDAWTNDILPMLDRRQYVRDDGRLMDDDEVRAFLGEAWRSIATNGRNKLKPGQRQGTGMMANRNAEARSIHFKNADAYMAYQAKYGEKALLQVMVDHIGGMARDTAAVEVFGPNPNAAFEYFRDTALKEAADTDPQHIGRYEEQAVKLTNLWNVVQGEQMPVANEKLARGFEATRNWLVASRLGSAVLSSIADAGTIVNTARVNKLPIMQVFRNELAAMNLANKEELRQARRAGLALDTAIGDLNRWGTDTLTTTVPAKLAHATLRASGLNAITDVRRRAFGVTMMDSIGYLTRNVDSLARLDADDNRILLSKGITEADWTVWRAATPEKWGGNDTVLTPDAVYGVPDHAIEHMISDPVTRAAHAGLYRGARQDPPRRSAETHRRRRGRGGHGGHHAQGSGARHHWRRTSARHVERRTDPVCVPVQDYASGIGSAALAARHGAEHDRGEGYLHRRPFGHDNHARRFHHAVERDHHGPGSARPAGRQICHTQLGGRIPARWRYRSVRRLPVFRLDQARDFAHGCIPWPCCWLCRRSVQTDPG
jgi:hypothetical protein